MSKLKLKDKFKKLAQKLNISDSASNFYDTLIDCSLNGVVYRDMLAQISFSNNDIFELKEHELITFNRQEQTLFLNPYNDIYYYRLVTEKKRRYIKTTFTPLLNSAKINGILFRDENAPNEIIYTTKTRGFKIPESFRPYFTSEPIPDLVVKNLMQSNPKLLELEVKKRTLPKEVKTILAACMSFSSDGVIRDGNAHSLGKSLRSLYNLRSFPQSTVTYCINVLKEVGILREYTDTKNGTRNLKIVGYKEAFDNHEHYIIVPDCVFKKHFKQLQAGSIKLFYDILFKLNNGENDKDHYVGQKKAIYMKFKKTSLDSKESKEKFELQNLWLKKRYPGEIREILFGSITDKDYTALAEYFHFTKPDKDMDKENVLQIRIRSEYFISKKAELFKPVLALKKKDKEKYEAIENALAEGKIELTDQEIIGIVKLFRKENIKVIRHLISKLIERINKSIEGYSEIEYKVAYLAKLYKNLEPT